MNLNISKQHLILLVSALNDAIKYNEGFLRSETIKDISDYEDHLLCLENCQGWLEDEYKRLRESNLDLMEYEKVIRI
ncbi:MAG: hypothetical protein GY820_35825 [Gammaproteobacteria bacterium]|nr:hypothetical protein [Gammaproteobacteria bacterium]